MRLVTRGRAGICGACEARRTGAAAFVIFCGPSVSPGPSPRPADQDMLHTCEGQATIVDDHYVVI